jgi:hypothetical protein
MTENQVHVRPFGKAVIEVDHLEAATIRHAAERGKPACPFDGDRRDIDAEYLHPAACQPDRRPPRTTPNVESAALAGEQVLEGSEDRRRTFLTHPCFAVLGMSTIPAQSVGFAHELRR